MAPHCSGRSTTAGPVPPRRWRPARPHRRSVWVGPPRSGPFSRCRSWSPSSALARPPPLGQCSTWPIPSCGSATCGRRPLRLIASPVSSAPLPPAGEPPGTPSSSGCSRRSTGLSVRLPGRWTRPRCVAQRPLWWVSAALARPRARVPSALLGFQSRGFLAGCLSYYCSAILRSRGTRVHAPLCWLLFVLRVGRCGDDWALLPRRLAAGLLRADPTSPTRARRRLGVLAGGDGRSPRSATGRAGGTGASGSGVSAPSPRVACGCPLVIQEFTGRRQLLDPVGTTHPCCQQQTIGIGEGSPPAAHEPGTLFTNPRRHDRLGCADLVGLVWVAAVGRRVAPPGAGRGAPARPRARDRRGAGPRLLAARIFGYVWVLNLVVVLGIAALTSYESVDQSRSQSRGVRGWRETSRGRDLVGRRARRRYYRGHVAFPERVRCGRTDAQPTSSSSPYRPRATERGPKSLEAAISPATVRKGRYMVTSPTR